MCFLVAVALLASKCVFAQTRWDLPTADRATDGHSENLQQFANDGDRPDLVTALPRHMKVG